MGNDFEAYIDQHLDAEIEDILAEGSENEPHEEPYYGPTHNPLTARDVRNLTLYKWRYSLESAGYSTPQAENLLFLKWLNACRPERVR